MSRSRSCPASSANGVYTPRDLILRFPIRRDEVATAVAFLSFPKPIQTPSVNSYSLKHAAENWGARHGMRAYISNGALIVAAVELGLAVRPYGPDCPNVRVGVGKWSMAAVP
jgi:hypothetical protein